jgi:hypothetical protein
MLTKLESFDILIGNLMRILLTCISLITLFLSAIILFFSTANCSEPNVYSLIIAGSMALVSAMAAVVSCSIVTPLLYKLALLGFPAVILPVTVIFTSGKVAYHGQIFQTPIMAGNVLTLGLLSISSSILGWKLGDIIFNRFRIFKVRPKNDFSIGDYKAKLYVRTPLILLTGYLTSIALGPPVWEAAYASQSTPLLLDLGGLPSLCGLLITVSITEFICLRYRINGPTIFFGAISIFSLIYFMLIRGMRLEPTAVAVAIFVVWNETREKPLSLFFLMVLCILLFLIIQLAGVLRANGSISDYLAWLGKFNPSQYKSDFKASDSMIHFGTASDISATLFMTVGLVGSCVIPKLYGQSYFDYFARTIPQFIFPDRPQDKAHIFNDIGFSSGGGFFELAEAYFNFGVIGCIIVPLIIATLLSICYLGAKQRHRLSVWFLSVILFSMLRGTWYQNFAIYKTLVVGVVVDLIGVSLIVVLFRNVVHAQKNFSKSQMAKSH